MVVFIKTGQGRWSSAGRKYIHIYTYIYIYIYISSFSHTHTHTQTHIDILSTFLLRAGCDTRSIFKWSKADVNSEFYFSLTGCLTKTKELSILHYLPVFRGDEFMPASRALVRAKTQPRPGFELGAPILFSLTITVTLSISVYTCVCIYRCVCVCVGMHICVSVCIYMCVYMHIYMCVCVCAYIYIYICVCVCVCVCVCIYIYLYKKKKKNFTSLESL